jgi:hypothetical protein
MLKHRKHLNTIILITTGFEEDVTAICLKGLRHAGLKVNLVGLTPHLITGTYGLTVRPDCSIGDVDPGRPQLVVIPGSPESAETLLADPRFHRLFGATTANGGQVIVMRAAESAFLRTGLGDLLIDPRVVVQGERETAECIDQLIHFAAG